MNLGKLHKLLASNRIDKAVQETRFIGELIDTARIIWQEQPTEKKGKNQNPYAQTMKHAFSTTPSRTPISAANARAIIAQKHERFFEVQKYIAEHIADSDGNTLKGLENIVKEIVKEDNLYIPRSVLSMADINQYDTFLNYVSTNSHIRFDEEKVWIYADYIAEYYYYSVLWHVIDYTLPEADDIREPFMRNEEKCREIINRNLKPYPKPPQSRPKIKVQDNHLIMVMDRYIEVFDLMQRKCDSCRYRLPNQNGDFYFIEDVLLNDQYLVLMLREAVLIYKRNCESLYRYIKKPKDASQLLWASLKADNTLIVYADDYYLEIKPDQIARDQQGKSKKTEAQPDYQMELLDNPLGKESCTIEFKPQVEQDIFYISTGDGIVKRSVLSSEGDTTILPFRQKVQFKRISLSPDERYILLEEFNHRVLLLDREAKLKFPPLVESAESNLPDFIDQYLEEQNGDALEEQEFSSDSRYLLYSHKKGRFHVFEIIDLQTGRTAELVKDKYFVGFMSDNTHFITYISHASGIELFCYNILTDDKGNIDIQHENLEEKPIIIPIN